MPQKLDIVIVNWNAGVLLRRCLESIVASRGREAILASVAVVDNASGDGSLEGLDSLDLPLRVVRLEENLGYGKAANLGAKEGSAGVLLFLNPDITLPPDCLEPSLSAFEQKAPCILGVALLDEAGQVSRSCARFPGPWQQVGESLGLPRLAPRIFPPTIMTDWAHDKSRAVDHVMGAFSLMPRSLFEALGGFDPGYFVYWEDLDLSLRARGAGAFSYFERAISARHKGGGTTEKLSDGRRLALALHARQVYARKHFSRAGFALTLLAIWPLEFASRLLWSLLNGSPKRCAGVLEAYRLRLTGENPAAFENKGSLPE